MANVKSIALILLLAIVLNLQACGGGSSDGDSGGTPTQQPIPQSNSVRYATPQTYVVGQAIAALIPTTTGPVLGFSVAPALPAGLVLNTSTGVITGTPLAASAAAVFTITADNGVGGGRFDLTITVQAALLPPPTGLSYPSPQTYVLGTAIAPLNPTVNGTVEIYGIAPALPDGLSFDPSVGRISGTPLQVRPPTTYTVTAHNSGGSVSFDLVIGVNSGAPNALSYPSPRTFVIGISISPLLPTVTGTPTSYTVSPPLPGGLSLNATSGHITGIPTTVTPQTSYTVTASNGGGSTTFALSLTIVSVPLSPPTGLSYVTPVTYTAGTAIPALLPSVTGTVTSYGVSPALPAGLVLNTGSGAITGTPTSARAQAVYTVTASNPAGAVSFGISITVNPAAPSGLSYQSPVTLQVGTAVTLDPTVQSTVTSFEVSPALPPGLSLNTTTGRISGTPTAVRAQATYTVTARNVSGSTSFGLVITVNQAAPSGLSYPSPWTYVVGFSISPMTPTVTGTVSSYSVTPALPAGITLNTTSGLISGTPTTAAVQTDYTVTASNVSGSTTFALRITVNAIPPSGLSYPNPQSYTVGTAITPLTPTVTGTVTQYTVSPALPAGLGLHSSSGQISGTPTAEVPQASYTITAGNSGGTTSFGLSITVAPLTTAPAAPAVTVGYAIKQVLLNWAPVPGATSYRVYKNPDGSSGYTQIGGALATPGYSDAIAVHLTEWLNARYIVAACNNFGCTDSPAIFAMNSAQAIGYFKASDTEEQDTFGWAVAISSDGNTLAVGATGKDGDATGFPMDCPPGIPCNVGSSGAVYVFVRSGSNWTQQAFLQAPDRIIGLGGSDFGRGLSLSADGNTLAVGDHSETSNATGIDGDGTNRDASGSGAVYVFVRSDSTWSQQAYIKASNTDQDDTFGKTVSLSSDGNTLAVGAENEDSSATGIDGDQFADDLNVIRDSGAVYVFVRSAGSWSQQAYIKASNTSWTNLFGYALSLSGDGGTLAVGAISERSSAVGINGDQTQSNFAGSDTGAVYVFTRTGQVWSQQAYIKASDSERGLSFGHSVALSTNGATLAVGAICQRCNNTQPYWMGRAYVFTRENGTWSEQAILRSSNLFTADYFGAGMAISGDGNILAVSAPYENSNAIGINGDQTNQASVAAGAVYMFRRSGAAWLQTAYVKSSRTKPLNNDWLLGDIFGFENSVALSGNGTTLAVGAFGDDSNTVGVGGNPAPAGVRLHGTDSGAVYVY